MNRQVRKYTAVIAASIVLACMGLVAFTDLESFAGWPVSPLWMGVVAVLCGILLATISGESTWPLIAVFEVAALAVLIFGAAWTYILWQFVRQYVSYFELMWSTFVFVYIASRGLIVFVLTLLSGMLGVVAAQVLLPERYRY